MFVATWDTMGHDVTNKNVMKWHSNCVNMYMYIYIYIYIEKPRGSSQPLIIQGHFIVVIVTILLCVGLTYRD